MSPIDSSYTKRQTQDFYDVLQNKLITFPKDEYTIIGGDFNARTGTMKDFICENEADKIFLNLPDDYETDKFTSTRNNQDIHINPYGEKLIDLCIASRMRILNGRTIGDLQGKFTYFGYNGVSTNDYVIASENFLRQKHIHSFTVEDITSLSDHRPLTLKLKYSKIDTSEQNEINLFPKLKTINIKNIDLYKTELDKIMDSNTIFSISNRLKNSTNQEEIINMMTQFSDLYINAVNKSIPIKHFHPNNKNGKNKKQANLSNNKKWYDKECKTLKRQLNCINKSLQRDPKNHEKRITFFKTQKSYKKLLRHKKRKNEEQLIEKLENLFSTNRNEFWNLLKTMKDKNTNEELPQINDLIDHFEKLYSKEGKIYENDNDRIKNVNVSTPNTQKEIFDKMNIPITLNEVEISIRNLKSKKSPGFDRITNEMIRCTNSGGQKMLALLFNKILESGIFPPCWNYGLIKLINKGNDMYDPNNYRGITLNSCVGKLFCSILYKRLEPILENNNIYCKEQAGFRQDHRTTDHIFLLRSIIKKYTTKNNKLFTCFVDFSKAFDSVWREALIKKLENIGIHGNFLEILNTMYKSTTNSIIYKKHLTPIFNSDMGVKQGDCLSAILFNLYINDLPKVLNVDGSDPVTIESTPINCLKYADDLTLMSTSASGLQKCIDELAIYCEKWKLSVNFKKTKIIIFNQQGFLIKRYKFFFNLTAIESINEYKYLGFLFSNSASTEKGTSNLINQAQKAWFSIRYYLSSSRQKNICTYLTLFDTQIKPILLYACEAWAETIKGNFDDVTLLTKNKLEKFQIKTYKNLLGVSRTTSNISILLELGRYPITSYMHYQTVKYFTRLSTIKNDRLLHEAYNLEKEKIHTREKGFINYMTNTLNRIGMSNIWIKQFAYDNNPLLYKPTINRNILKRFHDIFMQNALANIQNNNKLIFLNSLKDSYTTENYLKIKDFQNRKAISKLRTGNHRLTIETGRWTNIVRENRICTQCSQNKVEDEYHFLFDCYKHTVERNIAFEKIKNKTDINLFDTTQQTENLKMLFKSDSLCAQNILGKFIRISFSNREEC